jgi:hypothetical protein
MKEKIYTIPLSEAFLSGDECPFCHLERDAEQRAIRFTLGPSASYMEPEIREKTTQFGFCREHYKKMFDFSNPLGSALIMQSHVAAILEELEVQREAPIPAGKRGLFSRKGTENQPMAQWAKQRVSTCFLCDSVEQTMDRYFATFFYLLSEPEFRSRVENSNSFCMHHFAQLLETAQEELPERHREWFYTKVIPGMEENLRRVKGDLDWFVAKFDYRNASADWKNSRDAVKRTMQKLQGGYPADPPFRDAGKG